MSEHSPQGKRLNDPAGHASSALQCSVHSPSTVLGSAVHLHIRAIVQSCGSRAIKHQSRGGKKSLIPVTFNVALLFWIEYFRARGIFTHTHSIL